MNKGASAPALGELVMNKSIKLNGYVTTVNEMAVEVSEFELKKQAVDNLDAVTLAQMALQKFLASRGLGTDAQLKKNSSGGYYFQQYEDHGGHYSGYYEVRGAYREGDELVWNAFMDLLDKLGKLPKESIE